MGFPFFLEMARWRHKGLSSHGRHPCCPGVINWAVSLTNVMPGVSELNRCSLPFLFMPLAQVSDWCSRDTLQAPGLGMRGESPRPGGHRHQ